MKRISLILWTTVLCAACVKETVTLENPALGEGNSVTATELSIASDNTLFTLDDTGNAAIRFKSTGGKVIVDVNTNGTWSVDVSGGAFLTAATDLEADQLVLTAAANQEKEQQQATVTVSAGELKAVITVTQNAYGTPEITASVNHFHLAAVGELTASFEVSSPMDDWRIETEGCEWLLVRRNGSTIELSAYANPDTADRDVTFSLVAGRGSDQVSEQIYVLQDRCAYLTIDRQTIPFIPIPEEAETVRVDANFEWEYNVMEGNEDGWLTITKTDEGLTFLPTANDDATSRVVKIETRAGDGKENVVSLLVTVSQTGIDVTAFIIGVRPDADLMEVMLPFNESSDITVDWGDGSDPEVLQGVTFPTHVYTDPDYYIVSAKGTIPSLNASKMPYHAVKSYANQIEEVYSWGDIHLTSMENAFYSCQRLKRVSTDNSGAFKDITSMNSAFQYCYLLEAIPEGMLRYATKLVSVESMFSFCESVPAIPEDLFYYCPDLNSVKGVFTLTKITEIPEKLFSKNPGITVAEQAFSQCRSLRSIPDDLFSYTPGIVSLNAVFAYDTSLVAIPEGIFKGLTQCTSYRMAFNGTGIETIPPGLFSDSKEVFTDARNIFNNASKLKSVPEDIFEGCSKIYSFLSMFAGCASLESIPAGIFTRSGAQNNPDLNNGAFNNVLKGCTSLKEIPAGLFDGFSPKLTQATNLFQDCTGIETVPGHLFKDFTNVTSAGSLFAGCTSLKSLPEGLFDGLTKVTSFANLFKGCTALESVAANLLEGCDAVTNISGLFQDCTALTTLDKDTFVGGSRVTTIADIFNGCTALKEVPEDLFAPLTAVTVATSAFKGSGIETLPAGIFAHNAKITNFSAAFTDCASLKILPDGLFAQCPLVTNYTGTFENAGVETAGKIFPEASSAKATLKNLFYRCTSLKEVAAGIFDGLTEATSFETAFSESGIVRLPDGLFARNAAATTFTKCFQNCTSLQAAPSRMFNSATANKTLSYLFDGCTSLAVIPADAFGTLGATGIQVQYAFQNTGITEVPSGLFENVNASNYNFTFARCARLKKVGSRVINCYGTAATMGSTFIECTALEELSADMFINPVKVTSAASTFKDCTSLKGIPNGLFDEFKALKLITSLFDGCTALTGESPYTEVDGVRYHLYDRTTEHVSASGFVAITSANRSFAGCTGLSDFAAIPDAWKLQ